MLPYAHILLYTSAYADVCCRMPSYCYICVVIHDSIMCVLILLYMSPYYCICVLIHITQALPVVLTCSDSKSLFSLGLVVMELANFTQAIRVFTRGKKKIKKKSEI
jgi:hypothetical protein